MRIAHISDLHVTCFPSNPLKLFSKRFFAVVNHFLFRRKTYSLDKIDSFFKILEELQTDLLVVTGDLTTSSLEKEFSIAQKLLQSAKIPYIVIPGNHDKYTQKAVRSHRFFSYFSNPKPTFGCLKTKKVQAHQIQENLYIVTLDTAVASGLFSSRGLFSESLEKSLFEILEKIPKTAKIIILNHYPLFPHEKEFRTLQRSESLRNLLSSYPNAVLYLHGHTHRHCVIDLRKVNLPIILDSGSISHTENGFFNFIDIRDDSCVVSVYKSQPSWKKTIQKEYSWNLQ